MRFPHVTTGNSFEHLATTAGTHKTNKTPVITYVSKRGRNETWWYPAWMDSGWSLTRCRGGRRGYENPAGNQVSWGCSPGACAGSGWRSASSGSRPCRGTPQVIEWQRTMRSLYPPQGGCGLVRWLGSDSETHLDEEATLSETMMRQYKTYHLWIVSWWSPTCSPGPCVVCEGDRGWPWLGNGEQVCTGPVGQSWTATQNTHNPII